MPKQFSFTIEKGDSFVVTGRLYRHKKNFPAIHTESYSHAMGINLWNGSVWLVRNGKRILIERVTN